jgi:signal transduction histidine kinase
MNRAAEDLLDIRFSEVVEKPIDFAIEDNTLREKLVHTFNKKKTNYQFDFKLPSEDLKHPRIMRARTSIIFGKNGDKKGIVTIISDVTLEREIDRMKTEFISTAAHELRTPLTSIVGFSKILITKDDISEEENKKFISYIYKQGVQLANIVSDLLDISRIESGHGYELNKEKGDVREIIENIIPYFQGISLEHEFKVILPDKPVELYVDSEKFEQLVKNILSNAVKYSPEGGMIHISGEVLENDFRVSVQDNGIGMTLEQVERVFDKFYRADSSDSAPEGTGLGMVIVKHIVESHGGEILVESELGKGTIVSFTIPFGNKKNNGKK